MVNELYTNTTACTQDVFTVTRDKGFDSSRDVEYKPYP